HHVPTSRDAAVLGGHHASRHRVCGTRGGSRDSVDRRGVIVFDHGRDTPIAGAAVVAVDPGIAVQPECTLCKRRAPGGSHLEHRNDPKRSGTLRPPTYTALGTLNRTWAVQLGRPNHQLNTVGLL